MNKSQLKSFLFMLILATVQTLFAQDVLPAGLQSTADQIQGIFTGPIVTVILVCCLAGCGIAYAYNKNNEDMKKKVIAVVVGIIIIGTAKEIVGAIFRAAK